MATEVDALTGNSVSDDGGKNKVHLEQLNATSKREVDGKIYDDETKCGLFGIAPDWLQRLASKKSYILFFGLLGMNHHMMSSYFVGTISTIEKRFKMPSAKTGMIASAWDVGGLISSLLLAYFGGTGNKARWLSFGAALGAISCVIKYLPHAVYGPKTNVNFLNESILCNATTAEEFCILDQEGFNAFLFLYCSNIVLGIGTSTYEILGMAYFDDNVLKNKMPFLLSLSTCIRGIGSPIGYLLASYALRIFIDPSRTPSYDNTDARWIGAWWYGWIPLCIIQLSIAAGIALFPKTLPREAERRKALTSHWSDQKVKKSLKDFWITMKRLSKNKILMLNSFSSCFYVFGMTAYWIFMPKYMETQFTISASTANSLTGYISIICLGFGVMAGGSVMTFFKPRPSYLAAWNVFTETVDAFGHLAFAFMSCAQINMAGTLSESTGLWNTTMQCNSECNCPENIEYQPVCDESRAISFYSPCHAGCDVSYSYYTNGSANAQLKTVYSNCSCADNGLGSVIEGFCPVDCAQQFYVFLGLYTIMKFLSSTGRTVNTIIQFRSVEPQDKSISFAITETLLCALSFVPAPIFYGYLQDYSCLIWSKVCGTNGNCEFYDGEMMRYLINYTAFFFLFMGALLDLGVWYYSRDLQIYDEPSTKKKPSTNRDKNTSEENEEE